MGDHITKSHGAFPIDVRKAGRQETRAELFQSLERFSGS
jgi:hypothetical protein